MRENWVDELLKPPVSRHSNANLLHAEGGHKRYDGIAKALFAYAVQISLDAGFDGVLVFKAKTSDLLDYYVREFEARRAGAIGSEQGWAAPLTHNLTHMGKYAERVKEHRAGSLVFPPGVMLLYTFGIGG